MTTADEKIVALQTEIATLKECVLLLCDALGSTGGYASGIVKSAVVHFATGKEDPVVATEVGRLADSIDDALADVRSKLGGATNG